MGRLTALQKPNGSVRGIVASDVFRRLVARTMAQFQCALSTRVGTECIAHLWEDEEGVVHRIVQAEGGEQGDPLMPALSLSLGQHPALQAVQAQLQDGERLFASLDDVYVVCAPPQVNAIYGILQHEFFTHSSIRVHHGKTQVWNRGSVAPTGIEVLQAVARVHDPDVIAWRGDSTLRGVDQGVRILGPHWDTQTLFVPICLRCLSHDQLLEKVLTVQDLQCAWLLLLFCCGARPELTAGFAAHHDASLRRCLSSLLGVAPASIYWDLASLPLCLGGLEAQHCSPDPLSGQAGQTVWR